jgi:AAA family ATP:ADP antiporter
MVVRLKHTRLGALLLLLCCYTVLLLLLANPRGFGSHRSKDPLFGLGANVALIISGAYVRFVSKMQVAAAVGGAVGDPWAQSLRYLMGGVVASGAAVIAIFRYMQLRVMTDPDCVDPSASKKAKTKTSMGMRESAKFLAGSPYIRNLAALVICYGMSINIVEVWDGTADTIHMPSQAIFSAQSTLTRALYRLCCR